MSLVQTLLMRTFGQPEGTLGRLGGRLMARSNAACGAWLADTVGVAADDEILEIGFGPGTLVAHLAERTTSGHITGIDPSRVMLEQATERNEAAIRRGRVTLLRGTADKLPFAGERFDCALSVNSMQIWPDAAAGLAEICRVLRPHCRVAFGFTPHSRQAKEGLVEMLASAGFADARLVENGVDFCVVAEKP